MNANKYLGWPAEARQLVERAIEAHGGQAAWDELRRVHVNLGVLSGPLPWAKGLGRTHTMPEVMEVDPRELRVTCRDYPEVGQLLRFENGNLTLESTRDGTRLKALPNHRKSFDGWKKYRRWSNFDAIYFFGYALLTYLSVPFILPDLRFVAAPRRSGVDGVSLDFPEGFSTHCRRQSFFFDADGRLGRHDYVADIVGSWARAAHFSDDYVEAGGLQWARGRRVVVAAGPMATPVRVLTARLEDFRVHSRSSNPEAAH